MPRFLRELNVPRSNDTKSRARAICAWAALLFTTFAVPPARAAQAPNQPVELGLHTYESELQRYSDLIERAQKDPSRIAAIRKSLPPGWVISDKVSTFYVSTDPIEGALVELQTHPSDPAQVARDIESRLADMRQSAIDMETASANNSITSAQTDAKRILQAREFSSAKLPSKLEAFEERIGQQIGKWLVSLFTHLHISQKMGNLLAEQIIILVALFLAYWAYRTISQRERHIELPVSSGRIVVSDSREWVRDALAAADRGDYREAIHCAYWAAVARLEDLKLLKRDRARTPRESLRLLDAHPGEQTSLRDLTGHFELIWYGYRPASPSDWSEAKTLLEKFGCLAASTTPIANS